MKDFKLYAKMMKIYKVYKVLRKYLVTTQGNKMFEANLLKAKFRNVFSSKK